MREYVDCNTLQTHPCNEKRIFPVRKFSQGKTCFHYRDFPARPLYFPVRDCSVSTRCKSVFFRQILKTSSLRLINKIYSVPHFCKTQFWIGRSKVWFFLKRVWAKPSYLCMLRDPILVSKEVHGWWHQPNWNFVCHVRVRDIFRVRKKKQRLCTLGHANTFS